MKCSLTLCLLFVSSSSHSQFLAGDIKDFAKTYLVKNQIKYTESRIDDTTHRTSWFLEDEVQIILVFNNDDIVKCQTIIPENEKIVNKYVKWFNRDLVIISDTEWKNYTRERIYKIQLSYLLGEAIFSITTVPTPNLLSREK